MYLIVLRTYLIGNVGFISVSYYHDFDSEISWKIFKFLYTILDVFEEIKFWRDFSWIFWIAFSSLFWLVELF